MVISKADTAIDTNAECKEQSRRTHCATKRLSLYLSLALIIQTVPLSISHTRPGALFSGAACHAAEQDSTERSSTQTSAESAIKLPDCDKSDAFKSESVKADVALADDGAANLAGAMKVEAHSEFSDSLIHESLIHKNGVIESNPVFNKNINNFDVVSEGLWRGAAPSHQAMAKLAESGVKTIVDLRMAGQGAAEEKARAGKLGIKYIHIPLGFKGPSLLKVAQFLNIVNNPANQPVFVHCRYGADRTGALVAVFRVIHDHWTFNQAYTEMRSHHFKPWLAGLKRMVARVGGNASVQKELKYLTENGHEDHTKQVASKVVNRS